MIERPGKHSRDWEVVSGVGWLVLEGTPYTVLSLLYVQGVCEVTTVLLANTHTDCASLARETLEVSPSTW